MGVMGRILGVGRSAEQIGAAVGGVAEVFVGNRAERESAAHEERQASLEQFRGEFVDAGGSGFDRLVNGLNRLPRPLLALGTLALFTYSMAEPEGFGRRMEGLALVPDPLWWLLGAIVSFYFGARELHYQRARSILRATLPETSAAASAEPASADPPARNAAPTPQTRPAPRDTAREVTMAAQPATPVVARTPVEIPANAPEFNAAVEEWRRIKS